MVYQQTKESEKQTDLICGMAVDSDSEFKVETLSRSYFFCSDHCKKTFLKNPFHYLNRGEIIKGSTIVEPQSIVKTYFPLLLILVYLSGFTIFFELSLEFNNSMSPLMGRGISPMTIHTMNMMRHFMGGFFLVFSFFKFLNLKGFAEAYQSYDLIAQKFPVYGWIYPFIELGLGISYLLGLFLGGTNLITLTVMFLSSLGVARALLRKSQIQCACLGTVFKFPMTSVTLFEDLLMVAMALIGLICGV